MGMLKTYLGGTAWLDPSHGGTFGKTPYARVTRSTDQAIPTGGAEHKIQWQSEDYSQENLTLDSGPLPYQYGLKIPIAGLYLIKASLQVNPSGTSNRSIVKIERYNMASGLTETLTQNVLANAVLSGTIGTSINASIPFRLAPNDRIGVTYTCPANSSTVQANSAATFLSVVWRGPV